MLIELDGRRYEYEDVAGDAGAAPLVFLHEGLGSVGLWRGFPERVAAATGRRALVYSRLGHGESSERGCASGWPATIAVLPCGHAPHLEQPDETLAILSRFVAAHRSCSSASAR